MKVWPDPRRDIEPSRGGCSIPLLLRLQLAKKKEIPLCCLGRPGFGDIKGGLRTDGVREHTLGSVTVRRPG